MHTFKINIVDCKQCTLWLNPRRYNVESALAAIFRQSRVNTTFFIQRRGRPLRRSRHTGKYRETRVVENSINPAERCYRFPIAPSIGGREGIASRCRASGRP